MRLAGFRGLLIGLCLLPGVKPLPAQRLDDRGQFGTGGEARVLTFPRHPALRQLRQLALPVGVAAPLGRFTVQLGSAWVSTRLTYAAGGSESVAHVTDTDIRGSYVFGRDAVVATVLVNLPTGPRGASATDYNVIGAVSPTFLGFPVAGYASGFSVTGGLAGAIQSGRWSLGLAGSLRMNGEFTPYMDSAGPIVYKPGLEGRLRAGADGLVGASRLSLGLTYSTFGDDQVGATGGAARGQYRPGPRWLIEAGLVAPAGPGTLSLAAWSYHRAAGDTTGVSVGNRENLTAAEMAFSVPVAPRLALLPMVAGRVSKPQAGEGKMLGAGLGLRFEVSESVFLTPLARYDTGSITDASGVRSDLHGWYSSVFIRITY